MAPASATVSALGGRDALEFEWGGTNVDEAAARRWCWIEPWVLFSQDEDLFIVREILTSSPEHSRGIKVRLQSGEVGRVRRILSR
jgi:hypothetical protein